MLTTRRERVAGYMAKYVAKPPEAGETLRYEGRKALCRSCDRVGFYLESPSSGVRYCKAQHHELVCSCGELDTAAHDCAETWEWL